MAAAPRCDDAPPATADGKAGRGGKVDPPASESSAILQGTPRSDGAPAVADSPDAARWRHLLLFALLECSNSLMWITFSPIGDIVSSTFNVGSAAVNLLSTIYMWLYLPAVVVAGLVDERYGLQAVLRLGCTLNALGAALRYFAALPGRNSFAFLFTGQAIAAFAQGFTLSLSARVAAEWFPSKERALATSLGVVSIQTGVCLGMLLPGLLVSQQAKDLSKLCLVEAGAAVLAAMLIWLAFRKSPASPASQSSAVRAGRQPLHSALQPGAYVKSYLQAMVELVKGDRPFTCVLVSYGLSIGCSYSFATLINPILADKFAGDDQIISFAGVALVLPGLPAMLLAGKLLDAHGHFKATLTAATAFNVAAYVLVTVVLEQAKELPGWAVFCALACYGAANSTVLNVGFEVAAEMGYPATETTSGGLFNVSAQLGGVMLIAILDALSGTVTVLGGNLILVGVQFAGFVLVSMTKVKAKRAELDAESVASADPSP